MKSKEEIKKIAEKLYPISPNPKQMIEQYERGAFINGYSQCQNDMAEKKYTEEDLMSAFNAGINNDYGNGSSFDQWLNSLNKQDNEN